MTSLVFGEFTEFLASVWVELFFVTCFGIGFALMRTTQSKTHSSKTSKVFKNVQAEATAGNAAGIVSAWRTVQSQQLAPVEIWRAVVQAFLDTDPKNLINEVAAHLSQHASNHASPKAAVAALEVVARGGNERLLDELFETFVRHLHITPTVQMHEVLLGGYAAAGSQAKVTGLVDQLRACRQKVTVRGYSLMMKGFLKNDMLDAALAQLQEMCAQGLNVPSFAVPELFRVARQVGRSVDVFQKLSDKAVLLTSPIVSSVLEDCLKSQDLPLATSLEGFAKEANVQLSFTAYEALLKLYTSAGDMHAIELFEKVLDTFPYINEGLCVGLMARCAEPKFLRFADQLANFLRSRSQMTLVAYSALMKVYSYCNMYSEACDLYDQLTSEGFEPDSMMYGCLMKFSAECGRTDLTRQLSEKLGVSCKKLGVHHHMSLIRAAGQDKDVEKAFAVLQQFRKEGGVDTAICNAVLDVCCSAGDMKRAQDLLAQMKQDKLEDIISFNTLIKGYCRLGSPRQANEIMMDMEKTGIQPNDVSYNCLINLATSAGDFRVAWKTIETMERRSVRIDHYTVSTLLKALKRAPSGSDDIGRVMELLDRHNIDVCCEEVLLNTALEACMKHGETRRLEGLLDSMKTRSGMQLAAHTYASLVKAAGTLKQIERCRELWKDMTETRRIQPTGVALGCMLDALVCNGCVLEGVALLRQWEDRIEVNTILYSTLIKGFNNIGDAQGAMKMWNELRKRNLPLNSVVYNAIIDVHARAGDTSEISSLLESMEADKIDGDNITRSIVAKGFCMAGELDKAMDLLRKSPNDPKANNVIIYNTILDGCVRHDRMELADELLAKMCDFKVVPTNFTLGIIVKMWGRRRRIPEAFNAVRTLPKQYGFAPNAPVKTCLLYACLRNDKVSSALEIFEELRASGHRPDTKLFSALVNNCAKHGLSEQAVALVEDAYGLSSGRRALARGEQLEIVSLEQLMKCLAKKGELQKVGAPLLKKMLNAKVPVSNQVLSMVMEN